LFNLFRLCQKNDISFNNIAKTATTSKQRSTLSKQHSTLNRSTCSIRQYCLDIVAGVDAALDHCIVETKLYISLKRAQFTSHK